MRLGFAVFRRRGGAVFHFASEFDGFGPISVISPRLRRILEQPSGNPPERPETQTRFGPPGGTAAPFTPRGGGRRGISPHPGAPPPPSPPRWECWRWQGQRHRRPLARLPPARVALAGAAALLPPVQVVQRPRGAPVVGRIPNAHSIWLRSCCMRGLRSGV